MLVVSFQMITGPSQVQIDVEIGLHTWPVEIVCQLIWMTLIVPVHACLVPVWFWHN